MDWTASAEHGYMSYVAIAPLVDETFTYLATIQGAPALKDLTKSTSSGKNNLGNGNGNTNTKQHTLPSL